MNAFNSRTTEALSPAAAGVVAQQTRATPVRVIPSGRRVGARPSSLPLLPLQAKLEVGSFDDPLEREADRVARQVLHTPASSVPRRCACGGTPGRDGECVACKAKRLARVAITPAAPALRSAPPSVGAALSGPGRPLDDATRAFFEPRLGTDLGVVRIHDDATAADSARDVAAQAYTVGRNVVFGAGRYQPSSESGRALLAHELAHVVQQGSGRTTPRIQRKAQTYTIYPEHAPLSADEVLILMAMKRRGVDRAGAIRLIKDDEIGCGEHPACKFGVQDTKPIQFTVGNDEPAAKQSAPVKKAAPKKAAKPPIAPDPATVDIGEQPAPPAPLPADVESALDNPHLKRFFAFGTQEKYLQLPRGQPNPDDYVAVNYIRDAVLRLNEKELTCYRLFASEETLSTWPEIAKSLHEFSKVKADLCGAGDYPDAAPLERLRGAEVYYDAMMRKEALIKTFNEELGKLGALHPSSASVLPQTTPDDPGNRARYEEMQRQVAAANRDEAQAFGASGFKTVADFDRSANDFRLYFREYALRVAERMLFESDRVLSDAVARYQIRGDQVPRDCQELYDELYRTYGGRSVDQLKDAHPILRNPAALHAVSRAKNVYEFSWRLTGFANERRRDLGFVQSNLRREPDVVFRFDVVVKATLDELKLGENSLFAWVIREQRGKPGSTLGEKIVHYGIEVLLFALSFVSLPVGLTIGVARATGKMVTEGTKYEEGMREFEGGLREKPPSIAPVILAPVEELGPYAVHGVFSWLKGLRAGAGVEKLAAAGAGTERKLEQAVVSPHDAPTPPPAPHVETPPAPVTTEPPAGGPAVDVEPPVAPKPELAPVTTEPAAGVPVAEAPPVIAPDPRLAQAEERLAAAEGKAEAARARLGAASEKAAEAEQAKALADAELAQARQEAKLARAERARAKKAYDRAKPGAKAGPRATYTAAKNAADKAESKVASVAKRAKSAKKARGEAVRAVPRQGATVGRAEQAVAAAEEQRLIEVEADRLRRLPRTIEGLPPGWDYERFPNGPRRAWRPGDAINMPDANGNYPVWATVRKRIWISRATDELEGRAAGRVRATIPPRPTGPVDPNAFEQVPKGGLEWLDPIREATDKELAATALSGSMPSRLGAEIEHARIPQRAGKMLEQAGVDPNTARRVTKVGDPDNLIPTRKEIHAIVDEPARVINPNRNPTLEFSLDVRANAPFREATDEEIADIVKAIKNRPIAVPETEAQKQALERIRGFLADEKKLRPSSTWEVP